MSFPFFFAAFRFIVVFSIPGLVACALVVVHPLPVTVRVTIAGVLAGLSFSIVLVVGFWRHGLHFFSLFVPHGTPWPMIPFIAPIEFVSFMVRPFSLGLRLFVAMTAGHVLMEVFANFIVQSSTAGVAIGLPVGLASMALMIGISALELLGAGNQEIGRAHV